MTTIQNIVSKLSPNEIVRFIMDQRRERFLYNIPQERLTITSPYPRHSKAQLDMRRKAEVLLYSASQSNSKTNSLTKKEQFAYLSRSPNNSIISQADIRRIDYVVGSNSSNPTLTSSCDVPGPIITLQYDPTVPLYNYLPRDNSSYISNTVPDTSIFRIMTRNELLFLYAKRFNIYPDNAVNQFAGLSKQVREENVGVIIITNYVTNSTMNFKISTPLAIWMTGVTHMPNEDPTDSYLNKESFEPIGNSFIQNISITSIMMNIYCNQVIVKSVPVDTTSLTSLNFNMNSVDRSFYAIQYIGMVSVENLLLSVQSGDVYKVSLTVNYSYIAKSASLLRLFETGVFSNITESNVKESVNCVLNTPSPEYSTGKFEFNPLPNRVISHPNKVYIEN